MKLLICKRVSSRKLRLLVLRLSASPGGLGDAVEALGLCEGDRVGGFGDEDSEGGRGEEACDSGLGDEERERGLGEEDETDGGLGEDDRLRGLGEEERERGLGEDTRGTGEASVRAWVTRDRGLELTASPVAWMTLRWCLGLLSSLDLEPAKSRAGALGEDCRGKRAERGPSSTGGLLCAWALPIWSWLGLSPAVWGSVTFGLSEGLSG